MVLLLFYVRFFGGERGVFFLPKEIFLCCNLLLYSWLGVVWCVCMLFFLSVSLVGKIIVYIFAPANLPRDLAKRGDEEIISLGIWKCEKQNVSLQNLSLFAGYTRR